MELEAVPVWKSETRHAGLDSVPDELCEHGQPSHSLPGGPPHKMEMGP